MLLGTVSICPIDLGVESIIIREMINSTAITHMAVLSLSVMLIPIVTNNGPIKETTRPEKPNRPYTGAASSLLTIFATNDLTDDCTGPMNKPN